MVLASVLERVVTSVFILVRPKSHKIAVSASLISMFVCERDELVYKGNKDNDFAHSHPSHPHALSFANVDMRVPERLPASAIFQCEFVSKTSASSDITILSLLQDGLSLR